MTDLNVPDTAKPCVPLPRYELVPCWNCMRALGVGHATTSCVYCGTARYVRVDPEACPVHSVRPVMT